MKNEMNLTRDLVNFGLNPNDWRLKPTDKQGVILIQHKEDEDFCFIGKIKSEQMCSRKRKPKWDFLKLLGL